MLGKILITKQTWQKVKKINKLYIEEVSEIQKEYYLSCLVDRNTSKIAFITSKEGGVNIEEVAKKNPEKINTTKFDLNKKISQSDLDNIVKIFSLNEKQKVECKQIITSIFNLLIKKDANLIEINPLIITNSKNLCQQPLFGWVKSVTNTA